MEHEFDEYICLGGVDMFTKLNALNAYVRAQSRNRDKVRISICRIRN